MSLPHSIVDSRFYAGVESRFVLIGDAVPDAATMESYKDATVWAAVLAEIGQQLDAMLMRAETWSRVFGDRNSARDIADLDRYILVLEQYHLADRQAVEPRQRLYRLKVSIQRIFDQDVGVYRRRAASAQSLALDVNFR